jgi:hypothetical protein
MTNFSKKYQLQKQSGLSKKDWNIFLSLAASAVVRCVKEVKIKLEQAKSKVMMSAIQDTYRIYCGKEFSGLVTELYPDLLNMIILLKQKAIDKKKLADERILGEKEIEIFNRLEARGDPDKKLNNEEIYELYLSKFVKRGANMNKYSLPEMIKPNYVSFDVVKKMIDNKYKWGKFNIKSKEELKKLYEVAENLFNNMEDPKDAMKTVNANYNRSLDDKLYEISNNITSHSNYK